jgi:hypothetical protein
MATKAACVKAPRAKAARAKTHGTPSPTLSGPNKTQVIAHATAQFINPAVCQSKPPGDRLLKPLHLPKHVAVLSAGKRFAKLVCRLNTKSKTMDKTANVNHVRTLPFDSRDKFLTMGTYQHQRLPQFFLLALESCQQLRPVLL